MDFSIIFLDHFSFKDVALNETKAHCKNEVLINSDRVKYADQFLLTKLDEILTGL